VDGSRINAGNSTALKIRHEDMKPILFEHLESGQSISLWFIEIGVTAEKVDDLLISWGGGTILKDFS
jgi:hypothetical protein